MFLCVKWEAGGGKIIASNNSDLGWRVTVELPAAKTCPNMTSETSSGATAALFRTSLMTAERRSRTGTVDKAPLKEPVMVRAAETRITGSESALVLPHYRLWSSYCGPQGSRLSAGF